MSENKKLGQDPAFAACSENYGNDGMSKRFYAASLAMQGVVASRNEMDTVEDLITRSYELADELLKQEDEKDI